MAEIVSKIVYNLTADVNDLFCLRFQIWDDELEMLAQKNLLKCKMENDQCHRTKKFLYAGQNLAILCKREIRTPEEAIRLAIQGWWDEYKNITSIDAKNNYQSIRSSAQFGKFTQMARDKAFAMGCAIISIHYFQCYLIVCNYAITNLGDASVYNVGPIRSKCKTQSEKYPGLCGGNENYTNHTIQGIRFFNNEKTEVIPVKQWIANGRLLDISLTPHLTHTKRRPTAEQSPFAMEPTINEPATSTANENGLLTIDKLLQMLGKCFGADCIK